MLNTLKLQCDSNSKQSTFSAPCAPSTRGSEQVCTWSLILVQLFLTPWTVTHQALLSMGFSRQEYWGGLPFPPPGHLPDSGIKPVSSASPALAGAFFTPEPPEKPRGFEYSPEVLGTLQGPSDNCVYLSITTESWFTLCPL